MHLNYLQTVWSFWVLLLWCVRQVQRSAHSKANYSPLLSKIFPSFPPYATWIMRFSSLTGGIRHYFQPCGSVRFCSFYRSDGFSLGFRSFPHMHTWNNNSTLLNTWRGLSADPCGFLSVQLSPRRHSVLQILATLVSPLSSNHSN